MNAMFPYVSPYIVSFPHILYHVIKQTPIHQNPILSSKQFPSNTDANCSQPMELQAVRALVPTFIRENE
jgi:hypothetical protein